MHGVVDTDASHVKKKWSGFVHGTGLGFQSVFAATFPFGMGLAGFPNLGPHTQLKSKEKKKRRRRKKSKFVSQSNGISHAQQWFLFAVVASCCECDA